MPIKRRGDKHPDQAARDKRMSDFDEQKADHIRQLQHEADKIVELIDQWRVIDARRAAVRLYELIGAKRGTIFERLSNSRKEAKP